MLEYYQYIPVYPYNIIHTSASLYAFYTTTPPLKICTRNFRSSHWGPSLL